MGRLGNQMFQFASTLGIGRRRGYEVRFPIENFRIPHLSGPIDVKTGTTTYVKGDLIDCFNISEDYFIPSTRLQIYSIYNESKFEYDELTEFIPDGTTLNGYFQSEKYFSDIREELINVFTFKDDFVNLGNYYLENISNGKDLISLHVRRGDYTLYPDHHPTCDTSYYSKAVEEIKKLSGNENKIIVFSDDKEWCSENLGEFIGEDFIVPDPNNPYVELYMMTKCQYHIIANSSFSWWGSWLSDSKLTISPSKWFGPSMGKNTKDVYCKSWVKI